MSNTYKLVSTDDCPYAQRCVITFYEKKIPFEHIKIDPDQPPDWFLEANPLQRVPLLIVNEIENVFEASVINDFIDEISPTHLHPKDPLVKAQHRAWIELCNLITADLYFFLTLEDSKMQSELYNRMIVRMKSLNNRFGHGPYFSGENLSLVDISGAPFLRRYFMAREQFGWIENFTRLHLWWKNLEEVESIKKSFTPQFEQKFNSLVSKAKTRGA